MKYSFLSLPMFSSYFIWHLLLTKAFLLFVQTFWLQQQTKKNEVLEKEEHLLSCTHQHKNTACTELLQLSTGTGWCQAQGAADCPHAAAE